MKATAFVISGFAKPTAAAATYENNKPNDAGKVAFAAYFKVSGLKHTDRSHAPVAGAQKLTYPQSLEVTSEAGATTTSSAVVLRHMLNSKNESAWNDVTTDSASKDLKAPESPASGTLSNPEKADEMAISLKSSSAPFQQKIDTSDSIKETSTVPSSKKHDFTKSKAGGVTHKTQSELQPLDASDTKSKDPQPEPSGLNVLAVQKVEIMPERADDKNAQTKSQLPTNQGGISSAISSKALVNSGEKAMDLKHERDQLVPVKDSQANVVPSLDKPDPDIHNAAGWAQPHETGETNVTNIARLTDQAGTVVETKLHVGQAQASHTVTQLNLPEADHRHNELSVIPESGPALLGATPKSLEVGMASPAHGWLKIRAEIEQGVVSASVTTRSSAVHEMLHHELPSLTAFLQEEKVNSNVALVNGSTSMGAGQDGEMSHRQQSMNRQHPGGKNAEPSTHKDDWEWESGERGTSWWNQGTTLLPALAGGSGGWLNVRV